MLFRSCIRWFLHLFFCGVGMTSGIYQIKNNINGGVYFGRSVDVADRMTHHRNELRRGVHRNKRLQNAWNKYGENAFKFECVWKKSLMRCMTLRVLSLSSCGGMTGYTTITSCHMVVLSRATRLGVLVGRQKQKSVCERRLLVESFPKNTKPKLKRQKQVLRLLTKPRQKCLRQESGNQDLNLGTIRWQDASLAKTIPCTVSQAPCAARNFQQ